jgi:[CysO sulfur-carrier protein]-S-L-cysteine hydrolase
VTAGPTPARIPRELLAAAARHACACFPDECCGYLVGDKANDTVDAIVQCRNAVIDGDHPTHPERGPQTGYVIGGQELLAFVRTFDGPRPARVVYHSHTNGRAYFSEVDRENARYAIYPVQHLVLGVTDAGVAEAALYAAVDVGDFVEVARWPAAVLG